MNSGKDKTVAVIDPIWVGHHPMYFAQFAASFLRQGAKVIALCPEPDDARRELEEIVDAEVVGRSVVFKKLELGRRSFFGDRFEGDPLRTSLRWKQAAEVLDRAEEEAGGVDFVYFPYLDTYLRFLPVPLVPEILLGRKWSGLYLRNHHHAGAASVKKSLVVLGKGDALLRSGSCLGVGVLDERFIPQMESHSGKDVRLFPDFTNMALPEKPTVLAEEIRAKASGRKIVGIIGLERRKGILTLLAAAEKAHLRGLSYFFACCGRIFRQEYSREEWDRIVLLSRSLPNLHLDTEAGRIPSEAEFNSLFSIFDIAWAAYENFQGSSNTLGKAAYFGIPCLGSEGGCIGGRLKAYGTGLTIPEGDAERALEAICSMAENPPRGRYEEFRGQNSIQRLDELLAELLAKV